MKLLSGSVKVEKCNKCHTLNRCVSFIQFSLCAALLYFVQVSVANSVGNSHLEGKIVSHPQEHATCNKELCASIVSYCLIQDLCSCHPTKNCSCCAECALCLGDYYRHCCDCVGKSFKSDFIS